MTLFLDEACVAGLVGMEDALGAVEEVFAAAGRLWHNSRQPQRRIRNRSPRLTARWIRAGTRKGRGVGDGVFMKRS